MAMYEHRLAYRYANGEVEGFKGSNFTKPKAKAGAIEQIRRKLDIIRVSRPDEPAYDKDRLIDSPSRLSPADLAIVQADWRAAS